MEITMPQLGESVTEGTILRWFASVGDRVEAGELLAEIATDKVDAEVPSPVSGVVTDLRVGQGATVPVGAVLAVVDVLAAAEGVAAEPSAPAPPQPPATAPATPTPAPRSAPAPVGSAAPPTVNASPLARRILREAAIAVAEVDGTGRLGRVTRQDAERAARRRDATHATPGSAPAPVPEPASVATSDQSPVPVPNVGRQRGDGDTVVPLSRIRQRTASHMVASRAVSPHAHVAVEVRYDGVERARGVHREAFRAAEGIALTYLPFISRAAVDALRRFPAVNASVATSPDHPAGDGLALHRDVNLAFAVDLAFEGLVAPVVHHADDFRLRALARRIGDAARRARAGDLGPDDLAGGTFTITNSGSYGTHLVIPIINQPQVAILSTDAVRRRPVVVSAGDGDEAVGIGSVGILALSWDHRAFDGAYASAFLHEVRAILETRDWEAELR